MIQRVLLIANTKSRRAEELVGAAMEAFGSQGIAVTQPPSTPRDQLTATIRQHAAGHEAVAVLGGDGTINAALPGVLASNLPLAVLPGGTANDFARTLDLPADMPAAVGVIAAGHTRAIDVAEVNGHPFVNAASLGLTIAVTRQLDPELKKKWGVIAYAIACWRAVRSARGFAVEITQRDGRRITLRSMQLVVGNGRYFGGGMTVETTAAIDDGILNLYSVRALPWYKLLLLFPALRYGTHVASQHVHNVDGTVFTLRTRRPRKISADGEILTETPATFRVYPQAIRVFAPAVASTA